MNTISGDLVSAPRPRLLCSTGIAKTGTGKHRATSHQCSSRRERSWRARSGKVRLNALESTQLRKRAPANRSTETGPNIVPFPIVRPKPGAPPPPPIRTQARSATILPNFVGLKFEIHNGKIFHEITITEEMVGHKLGEFSPYVTHAELCLIQGSGIDQSADGIQCRTRKRYTYKLTKNK